MLNNNQPKQPHQLVNHPSGFINQDDQFFPRTQSTPPEEPKKTSSSGKLRLKASTSFIPTGNINHIIPSFLTSSTAIDSTASKVKADISQNNTIDTSGEVNLSASTLNSSVESNTQKTVPMKRKRLNTSSQNFAFAPAKPIEVAGAVQDVVPEQIQEEQEETKIESDSNAVPETASKVSAEEQQFQDPVNVDIESTDEQEIEALPGEAKQQEDDIKAEEPIEVPESQPKENIGIVKMDRNSLEETIKRLADLLDPNRLSDTLVSLKNRKIFSQQFQRAVRPVRPVKPTDQEEPEIPHLPFFIRAPALPTITPNTWLIGKQAEEMKDSDEAIKKKIKLNLNILTPDNFEKVSEFILNIAASSLENCKRVAESIVENAWKQKHYASTYARLCTYLGTAESLFFGGGDSNPTKKRSDFKVHIIKQIQLIFESDPKEDSTVKKDFEKMDEEQKMLYLLKKKEKILGNMRFIGELFLEKFIVVGVVYIVTVSLLQKFLQEYHEYKSNDAASIKLNEDSLEGLIKFYETIGATVEEKENTKNKTKTDNAAIKTFQKLLFQINNNEFSSEDLEEFKSQEVCLNDLFKILDVVLKEVNISTRMNSLIINLVEMRNNGWKAPLSKGQGPKTMKQIQEEFEREQSESQRNGQSYRDEHNKQKYQPQPTTTTKSTVRIVPSINQTKITQPKFDANTMKIDTQIVFKPNRSKGTQQQQNPEMSVEEIQKELKEVYKLINGDQVEDKLTPEEELKKLANKASGKRILEAYFEIFCDGRLDVIKKRLFIPDFLLKEKLITEKDFLEKFSEAMEKMYEMACDYPELDNSLALIFLNYCAQCEKQAPFNEIVFSQGFFEKEEAEFILEFYQDFLKAVLRNLEENYRTLKENVAEDDLKAFAIKIGIADYDALKSSV